MIETITMYRVVCDAEDCDNSPGDETGYRMWNRAEAAIEDATEVGWNVKLSTAYCEQHLHDVCSFSLCENTEDLAAGADLWMYCPEHLVAPPLPVHRTEAGYPRCSTCNGVGCLDCTDPA